MQTTRYKNDGALRRRLFTPESYSHPAKGHMGMWEDIITRYTKEGDTVLDPMSGVGSTLLAALMGRNVVCVELEEHFVTMLKANWEKARQHPMLGYSLGNVAIIHGDARNLTGLLADAVITSPPWEEQNIRAVGDEKYGSQRTGGMRRQIKNTNPYTRPSAIITSPPWEDQGESHSTDKTTADHSLLGKAYTRPVDAVVTSPPYEGGGHHEGAENIGNMRGAKYWGEQGMTAVYRQCYAVLKPGGVMALVVKGFTRDGKYVDLPSQTVELCESLGFRLFDRWARELWALSFWRILQKRRDPAAFDDRLNYEEVLAFHKPSEAEAQEPSVDAVLTSPPYEGIVGDNKEGPNQTSVPGGWKANTVNKHGGYTRPPADAVVFSPPWEDTREAAPLGMTEPYLSQYIERFNAKWGKGRLSKDIVLNSQRKQAKKLSGYTRPKAQP